MLKSYKAFYENGQLKWLEEQPPVKSAQVIVTIVEEVSKKKRREPPPSIAGKGKTLGDLIQPLVDEADWECLK